MTTQPPKSPKAQNAQPEKSRAQIRREEREAYRKQHGRGGRDTSRKGPLPVAEGAEPEAAVEEAALEAPKPPRHRAKHRLGQNFLKDQTVIDKIVEAAELSGSDQVLEIGPGLGVLTEALAPNAGKLVAVELDRALAEHLAPIEAEFPQLSIVWQDFMKTEWEALGFDLAQPIKVVANIPYYITTPILMKLLQADRLEKEALSGVPPLAERILLMVQYEVAKRLTAKPGNKDFGSLTLIAQYAAEVSIVTKVPAGAFRPRPQVDSAVVMLKPRHVAPVEVTKAAVMFRLIRMAFQQRRKTLLNGLQATGIPKAALEATAKRLGFDLGRRAETLALQEWATLANALVEDGAA
ncbi:Ribosomal RNA small subunit methyltransferase A [compost metagenome]